MLEAKPVVLRFARRSGAIYIGLLTAAVAGCWSPGAGFLLFLFGIIAFPLSLLVVSTMLAYDVWSALFTSLAALRIVAAVLVGTTSFLLTVALTVPILQLGNWLGNESLLLAYHDAYISIIDKVQKAPLPLGGSSAWQHEGSVTFVVDYGEPRRVAFEPSGFLDNWSGIIWDPTHEVLKANGFDQAGNFYAPERITKLFGGDLVKCHRLGGDWFACSFT